MLSYTYVVYCLSCFFHSNWIVTNVVVIIALGNSAAQLENSAAQLENSAAQLDNSAAQLDNSAAQLDNSAAQLGNSAAQLGNSAAQPRSQPFIFSMKILLFAECCISCNILTIVVRECSV